ncbi:MAG: 4Fe-4S binding protein [Planctomycetes bacterium]|nr:4Fe-4S binding protein [Planctomycetota bacterium]
MTAPTDNMSGLTGHPWVRTAVQIGFLVFSLFVCWQFHTFVIWLSDPTSAAPHRPPSVDAWLPIGSLMSLTHLLRTGEASSAHPAGLVIFSLILVLSLAAGRGFCSWVCPIGTLSEWSHKAGKKLLGRNLLLPRWIDIPLRGVKYLLLGFFLYAILRMPVEALRMFLEGPYNRIADVKMYLLFAEMTRLTAIVLAVLLVLSVLVKNFWCRYLCPYGAFLGLFAWRSLIAVRRDAGRCTGCRKCENACPNRVRVWKRRRVGSLECTMCFDCVRACLTRAALAVSWPAPKRNVTMPAYAAILVGTFIMVSQAARSAGYWESGTDLRLYAALYNFVHQIDHPRTPWSLSNQEMRQPLQRPVVAQPTASDSLSFPEVTGHAKNELRGVVRH